MGNKKKVLKKKSLAKEDLMKKKLFLVQVGSIQKTGPLNLDNPDSHDVMVLARDVKEVMSKIKIDEEVEYIASVLFKAVVNHDFTLRE